MDGVRPLLLIRADANSQIGSGHLMRCWALGLAWIRRGGRTAFACRPLPGGLESQILASGCEILPLGESVDQASEASAVRELVRTRAPLWLVLDGYDFDLAYRQKLASGARDMSILWIDDRNAPQETPACLDGGPSRAGAFGLASAEEVGEQAETHRHDLRPGGQVEGADRNCQPHFVLNQNVYADYRFYPASAPEQILCGPAFALLREQFSRAAHADLKPLTSRAADADLKPLTLPSPPLRGRGQGEGAGRSEDRPLLRGRLDSSRPRDGGTCWQVLVTMGGADAANGTALILRSLATIRHLSLEVNVALGAGNPHVDSIRELARTLPLSIRIEQSVSDMATWMRRSDLAIAAAGSTTYELAACGVPAMLVVTAPNQAPVAQGMAEAGIAVNLGELEHLSPAALGDQTARLLADGIRRQAMAEAGRQLVDGRGAARVADFLLERSLRIRPATIDDASLLYAWQQDPAVRAASFTAGPADFAQHHEWLENALSDPNKLIELFTLGREDVVGCVRWAVQTGRATIGIVIDAAYRGRGLAPLMLRRAVQRLSQIRPAVAAIDAWIRPENEGSRRSFAAAGFRQQRTDTVHGQPAELWRLEITSLKQASKSSAA